MSVESGVFTLPSLPDGEGQRTVDLHPQDSRILYSTEPPWSYQSDVSTTLGEANSEFRVMFRGTKVIVWGGLQDPLQSNTTIICETSTARTVVEIPQRSIFDRNNPDSSYLLCFLTFDTQPGEEIEDELLVKTFHPIHVQSVQIETDGDSQPRFSGVNALEVDPNAALVSTDDLTAGFTPVEAWSPVEDYAAHNGFYLQGQPWSHFLYNFTGSAIWLFGYAHEEGGTALIEFDRTLDQVISYQGGTRHQRLMWSKTGLNPTVGHRLSISTQGEPGGININFLRVLSDEGSEASTSTITSSTESQPDPSNTNSEDGNQKTSTAVLAGSIIGAVIGLLLVVGAVLFWLRRRRHAFQHWNGHQPSKEDGITPFEKHRPTSVARVSYTLDAKRSISPIPSLSNSVEEVQRTDTPNSFESLRSVGANSSEELESVHSRHSRTDILSIVSPVQERAHE